MSLKSFEQAQTNAFLETKQSPRAFKGYTELRASWYLGFKNGESNASHDDITHRASIDSLNTYMCTASNIFRRDLFSNVEIKSRA